jgi:hypothetical protein
MTGLVHPLEDVLGGLVETQPMQNKKQGDGTNGWLWMLAIVAAVGLLAWVTR